jgi:hypothetical protein
MLAIMLVDHVELYPSLFDLFTGRGRLFVSAAEGFFFLSGILVGLVYRRRLIHGVKHIFAKMWLRGFELYVLSIFFTLFYVFWAVSANHPSIKYGLPDPMNWSKIISQTLLLRYGFGWSDFLARFAILMMIAPFAFYLLTRGWWKILAIISVGLWVFRGQNFTLAWQLLYNGGMIIGYYWSEINAYFNNMKTSKRNALKRVLYYATAITFSISYASVYLLSYINERLTSLPLGVQSVFWRINEINERVWIYAEKWTLGPLRITLFIMWFSVLFLLVQKYQTTIDKKTRGIFLLLGRNSLFVYILHSFIVFSLKFVIPLHTNIVQNFIFTLVGLCLLVLGTRGYQSLRQNHPHIGVNHLYERLSVRTKQLLSSV